MLSSAAQRYGVPSSAQARLSALADGRAVIVATGQQVGYLGGPFYTFLKAYHAVQLAARLEHDLRMPVVPLFWLEGEDHDLEEVRHAHYPGASGELKTLRFDPDDERAGRSVGTYAVNGAAHIAQLAAEIGSANAEGLALLHAAYGETTLSAALGRLLAQTLGERGLLIIEGMDGTLKRMAAPLWERVFARGRTLGDALAKRSAELTAAGWSAILNPTPDAFLFYLLNENQVRLPLSYAGELRHPDGSAERLAPEQIERIVRDAPERISPKAALRPLYQDFVLPTIAYVAGPGELDYHAQLTPFYAELDVAPPVLFPRLSVTPADSRAVRAAEKTGFALAPLLMRPPHELARELVRAQDAGRTAELFAHAGKQIADAFDALASGVTAADPTLEGAVQTAAGKSRHALEQLRDKTERALKQRHAVALARLDKALALLKPNGQLGERVNCTGYYLARFGAKTLLRALDALPEAGGHFVIGIEDTHE